MTLLFEPPHAMGTLERSLPSMNPHMRSEFVGRPELLPAKWAGLVVRESSREGFLSASGRFAVVVIAWKIYDGFESSHLGIFRSYR